MFSLLKPGPDIVRAFLAVQKDQQFSYGQVGAPRAAAPNGYLVDHNRVQLGVGSAVFERPKDAIRRRKMFEISWLELCWPNVPIVAGSTSLNAHGSCER